MKWPRGLGWFWESNGSRNARASPPAALEMTLILVFKKHINQKLTDPQA